MSQEKLATFDLYFLFILFSNFTILLIGLISERIIFALAEASASAISDL